MKRICWSKFFFQEHAIAYHIFNICGELQCSPWEFLADVVLNIMEIFFRIRYSLEIAIYVVFFIYNVSIFTMVVFLSW